MFTSPNTANVAGPSQRRQVADRGGLGLHHGGALGDGHASPFPDRPATPAARAARSRYMARISGGAATNSTISA